MKLESIESQLNEARIHWPVESVVARVAVQIEKETISSNPICHDQPRLTNVAGSPSILRWGFSIATAVVVVLLFGLSWNTPPKPLWAQAAQEALYASSLSCRFRTALLADGKAMDEENGRQDWTFQWDKSGSIRITCKRADLDSLIVQPANRPGIEIDHLAKSYRRLVAMKMKDEMLSPILIFERLAMSQGQAKQDLGDSEMEGHPVHGFEVEMEKIDADLAGMQARVWVDKETKRIVRTEWLQMDIVQTMDHFVWNEPTEDWFKVSVPAGYTDQTTESVVSEPSNLEKTTQCIITSLKTFSKYSNGNYPKVKYLYGDTTSAQLAKLNGADKVIQRVFKPEDKMDDEAIWLWMESKPEYKEYLKAIEGFASINVLQGQNADAAYYGKTVSSKDKNRILFRWQLETGEYQVIFGDLSYRTVAKEQLRALETR